MGKWLMQPAGLYSLLLLAGVIFGTVSYRLFAERPLWAYFTLIVIGLVPLALFLTNRRVVHLFGMLVVLALMGGVYLLDAFQESDTETVVRISQELVLATEQSNHAVFDRYLAANYRWQSMDKKKMMERVRSALLPSESRTCSISSAQARQGTGVNEYIVEGNLTANGKFGHLDGFFTGTIELRFARQPDGRFQVVGTRVAWAQNGQEVVLPPGR